MGKSASGPRHRTFWSFLIPAPPACGCPRSSARARPVVSAGLPRESGWQGRALTASGERASEAGLVGPGCFNPESQGLGQSQGAYARQREEAGPGPGWSLCLPSHQHMLLYLFQPIPFCSVHPTPLCSILFPADHTIPSHPSLQHSFHSTPLLTKFSLRVS